MFTKKQGTPTYAGAANHCLLKWIS